MNKVYNWQLGRDMEYPYEAAYPDHQFAFIFNINRCIGCQSCTMACKSTWTFAKGQEAMWWNNVETKPYGGFPHGWDVKTLALLEKANPGGQTWDGAPKAGAAPYGEFKGKTIFEAGKNNISPEGANRALGYLPTVMAIRAAELTVGQRKLHNVVAGGARDGLLWRVRSPLLRVVV